MSHSEVEERCESLRNDLKTWEKKFAAAHDGRKAGREDIKADAAISQKYKEYNKLRNTPSGKAEPQTPTKTSTKHKPARDINRTPKALKNLASTPVKRKREDEEVTVECVASPTQLLSPRGPAFIGPTPQRDGKVLGLFDLLPTETPTKRRAVLAEVEPNVLQTPSKNLNKAGSETSIESRARGEKTPQSTGKRFLLDQFITPRKRKLDDQGTPSSAFKGFSTPAFLRRHNPLTVIDEGNEPTPRPAPWKRRSLGRSLSAMIQSMKKEEENRLDEEADIMRELEMDAEDGPAPKKQKAHNVLVEESQVAMPLGPDRGLETEEDDDEEEQPLGPDEQPRRVWKKKGLKRQTRRVIMKPNLAKPKPAHTFLERNDSDEDDSREGKADSPPETAEGEGDLSEDDASDYASDASHTPQRRKPLRKKPFNTLATQNRDSKHDTAGTVRAAARKVKATANANYRRLKIKSKGGNGGKGKFGRRR